MNPILLGPILGYEWDESTNASFYTVVIRAASDQPAPKWEVDGKAATMTDISGPLHDGSRIWRGETKLASFQGPAGRMVAYSITGVGGALANVCGDKVWSFLLPGEQQNPRIVFCSCNGFSDPKAAAKLRPLALWARMEELHAKVPFSLMLMGGDQLYCDDLARQEKSPVSLWNWLNPGSRKKATPSAEEFRKRYFDHYLQCWCSIFEQPHTPMVNMMASIPSAMIWDDHDIYDGFGSYHEDADSRPYHQEAFAAARLAFVSYQVRGRQNRNLLDKHSGGPRFFTQGFKFGPCRVLLLDNRSQRTPTQIMTKGHWNLVDKWAQDGKNPGETLLVVTPIPVVYRRFSDWVSELPGEHGGEDDLRDHWNHRDHEAERNSFIRLLFQWRDGYERVTLLSGDVHVGGLGFLNNSEQESEIAQVVSSGILHPPPGVVAWAGVSAISSDDDYSIRAQPVTATITRPQGAAEKNLRARNFVWMQQDSNNNLEVNWEYEDPKRGMRRLTNPLR